MRQQNQVRLAISGVAKETGALLTEYLQDRGVYSPTGAGIVCYGSSRSIGRALNAACGTDKIDRLQIMRSANVQTVPWFAGREIPGNITFPLLARKANGYGGTDIVPVFQRDEIPWRVAAGWDWFSSYVPVANEFRVWVFRGRHLDTYEKTMQRPREYAYIGRNFRNGFDFSRVSEQADATQQAVRAVDALGLDFAAVDLLRGLDGVIYVLEVNTAPGVIRSGAHRTLARLADCITEWAESGYPGRS